jgi:hypothetical protein
MVIACSMAIAARIMQLAKYFELIDCDSGGMRELGQMVGFNLA